MATVNNKEADVVIVRDSANGDWECLYINGQLAIEGHSLSVFQVAYALVGYFVGSLQEASSASFEDLMHGPANIADFPDLVYI